MRKSQQTETLKTHKFKLNKTRNEILYLFVKFSTFVADTNNYY